MNLSIGVSNLVPVVAGGIKCRPDPAPGRRNSPAKAMAYRPGWPGLLLQTPILGRISPLLLVSIGRRGVAKGPAQSRGLYVWISLVSASHFIQSDSTSATTVKHGFRSAFGRPLASLAFVAVQSEAATACRSRSRRSHRSGDGRWHSPHSVWMRRSSLGN
jgi:hypothetical protein